MARELSFGQRMEQRLLTDFRETLWSPFMRAIRTYRLIGPGDRVAVCVSGGKDSMLLAKLMQCLQRHSRVPFEAVYLIMDPGYSPENRRLIEDNARRLEIPCTLFESDVVEVAARQDEPPCFLCARMRRGCLYRKARELGCNKIALGHHFDDVIETTVMAMLYGGQIQGMPPMLSAKHFPGMRLIRPMYRIREADILAWRDAFGLEFIRCACRLTESAAKDEGASRRQFVKALLAQLEREHPKVPQNVFNSVHRVQLDTLVGWKHRGEEHSFLENLDETGGISMQTPFERHGALHVEGTRLMDAHGQPMQLRGVSTLGLAWYPQFVNREAFQTLRDDWGANAVRLAMYTQEQGGYLTDGDPRRLEELIHTGVRLCTQLGMYAIIDWHILSDNDPMTHVDEAVDFFRRMSARYGRRVRESPPTPSGSDRPLHYIESENVVFEICNEPNGRDVDWARVREYATRVVPVIRENAPNALILCGTPTWSQDVDQVAQAPLDDKNLMYSLHFYAATHKDALRARVETALDAGTPVFASECSICDASGDGLIDYDSAAAWRALIQKHGLSYIAWSLSNRDESAALIRPDCDKTARWDDGDLSETGRWFRNALREDREE